MPYEQYHKNSGVETNVATKNPLIQNGFYIPKTPPSIKDFLEENWVQEDTPFLRHLKQINSANCPLEINLEEIKFAWIFEKIVLRNLRTYAKKHNYKGMLIETSNIKKGKEIVRATLYRAPPDFRA